MNNITEILLAILLVTTIGDLFAQQKNILIFIVDDLGYHNFPSKGSILQFDRRP